MIARHVAGTCPANPFTIIAPPNPLIYEVFCSPNVAKQEYMFFRFFCGIFVVGGGVLIRNVFIKLRPKSRKRKHVKISMIGSKSDWSLPLSSPEYPQHFLRLTGVFFCNLISPSLP